MIQLKLKKRKAQMHIESLYRYPVKGLTPEPLTQANLTPGCCIPWDRAFALKQGDAVLNLETPSWIPKNNLMCLAKNPEAAALHMVFAETDGLLRITGPKGDIIASAFTSDGQEMLACYLTDFLGPQARYGTHGEAPHFHFLPGHSFCDEDSQVVSLIGLASLQALEQQVCATRDKRRFRANIYIEGSAAWEEFSWLGKKLAIGSTELLVQNRIRRCAATMVNPDTAQRDANPVQELKTHFGHADLGVFASVTKAGVIHPGDKITLL